MNIIKSAGYLAKNGFVFIASGLTLSLLFCSVSMAEPPVRDTEVPYQMADALSVVATNNYVMCRKGEAAVTVKRCSQALGLIIDRDIDEYRLFKGESGPDGFIRCTLRNVNSGDRISVTLHKTEMPCL